MPLNVWVAMLGFAPLPNEKTGKFFHSCINAFKTVHNNSERTVLFMPRVTLKRISLVCAVLLLVGCVGFFCSFESKCQTVRDQVLRLHIRAASDSAEDQALKLSVRDRLLADSQLWFQECRTHEQAAAVLYDHLDEIEDLCYDELHEQGSEQTVAVRLEESSFPTRTYGELTLPAGVYESLVIELDGGKGQNWWCVLFPAVCIPAATQSVSASSFGENGELVYEDEITYRVGFRVVEWYYQLRDWWKNR